MKRGDLVIIRQAGTSSAKARPCVVVTRDSALPHAAKVTVCPLTSHLRGAAGQRPFVAPNSENGLNVASEIEIDWIFTHPIDHIEAPFGHLDGETLAQVDMALRRWLAV